MLRWTGSSDLRADHMRTLIAALFAFPAAALAAPTFYSGNDVYRLCQEYPASAAIYAIGVLDGDKATRHWARLPKKVCAGSGVSSGQVKDVMCRYLERSPEDRHLAASSLALNAFEIAWPCPR